MVAFGGKNTIDMRKAAIGLRFVERPSCRCSSSVFGRSRPVESKC
uniref:Uncharacterized protein n=1 Tax=Arundo donax TaxID=35708 RepID=A0A0A9AM28_ARUDO